MEVIPIAGMLENFGNPRTLKNIFFKFLRECKMITEQEQDQFLRQLLSSDQDILKEDFFNRNLEDRKQILKYILRNQLCEVTFRKVDGSVRIMPCTLQPERLPEQEFEIVFETVEPATEQAKKPRTENPNTIRVYCLDKEEWRSFRIDNVISVKAIVSN
jgi:hypothetical protein